MTNPFDEDPWDTTAGADDPFADDDPFEKQRDNFPNADWVVNRLLLLWPTEVLTGLKGTTGDYSAIVCKVAVLDGEPTEDMPKIPCVIEPFRFNADSIIRDLKHLIGGKPKLARVSEKPSKANAKIMARFLTEPSAEDMALARTFLKTYK